MTGVMQRMLNDRSSYETVIEVHEANGMENVEELVFEQSSFLSNGQYDTFEHRVSERCERHIHPSELTQYVIGG
jgi:hypothetical protein